MRVLCVSPRQKKSSGGCRFQIRKSALFSPNVKSRVSERIKKRFFVRVVKKRTPPLSLERREPCLSVVFGLPLKRFWSCLRFCLYSS